MYNRKEGAIKRKHGKKGANFSTLFTWLQFAALRQLKSVHFRAAKIKQFLQSRK